MAGIGELTLDQFNLLHCTIPPGQVQPFMAGIGELI